TSIRPSSRSRSAYEDNVLFRTNISHWPAHLLATLPPALMAGVAHGKRRGQWSFDPRRRGRTSHCALHRRVAQVDRRKHPHRCTSSEAMTSLFRDAEYWRRRAQEMAALASSATDPNVRQMMAEIVQSYERLAEHADAANKSTRGPDTPSTPKP